MNTKPPRSPQEKKALSLRKDRRNIYGQNDKASRKAIPLRKAQESRRNRHKNNQAIAQLNQDDETRAALVESSARQDVHRTGGWTKGADAPLAEVIERQNEKREVRKGRKARERETQAEER